MICSRRDAKSPRSSSISVPTTRRLNPHLFHSSDAFKSGSVSVFAGCSEFSFSKLVLVRNGPDPVRSDRLPLVHLVHPPYRGWTADQYQFEFSITSLSLELLSHNRRLPRPIGVKEMAGNSCASSANNPFLFIGGAVQATNECRFLQSAFVF